MHRFIKIQKFQIGQTIELDRSEHHHMKRVMRKSSGQKVEIINTMGQIAYCTIQDSGELIIDEIESKEAAKYKKSLAIGLCQPNKLELIVEKACELNIDELIIYTGEKSALKALSQSKLQRLEMIRDSALKQSKRVWNMKITMLNSIFEIDTKTNNAYFASLNSNVSFKSQNKDCMIIIGPESGFGLTELDFFKENKIQGISLGKNVLRAETAAIVASFLLSD